MPVDSNNFLADKHLSCHCNLSFFFLFPVKLRQLIDFWESNFQATLLLWMYALSSVLVFIAGCVSSSVETYFFCSFA